MKPRTEIIVAVLVVLIAVAALIVYVNFGSGTVEIKMTDPPVDWGEATQVYLNFSSIEVHRAQPDNESGWFTVVDENAWINLTSTLDVNQTVGTKNLQSGLYNLIRFSILDARVTVAGANYTAAVPSGNLTVAITTGGIQVNVGQTASLLIELNVKVAGSIAAGFKIVPGVRATPI